MRATAPFFLLLCAIVTALVSLFGDDTYNRLSSLKSGLEHQQKTNGRLEDRVQSLRKQVSALQTDPRAIERAARGELGMSKPNEVTVVFDRPEHGSNSAGEVTRGENQ